MRVGQRSSLKKEKKGATFTLVKNRADSCTKLSLFSLLSPLLLYFHFSHSSDPSTAQEDFTSSSANNRSLCASFKLSTSQQKDSRSHGTQRELYYPSLHALSFLKIHRRSVWDFSNMMIHIQESSIVQAEGQWP